MKKMFRIGTVLLALLLCVSFAAPAMATSSGTPEITWLSAGGQPVHYNELGWLTLQDLETWRLSCIDLATGERVEYDAALGFFDGIAYVIKYDEDGSQKQGYIDTTGSLVIPLGEYDYIDLFFDGLAQVVKRDADGNWKYGYIDKTGAVVVPLGEYDDIGYFSDGLAMVGKIDNMKYGYIDTTGRLAVPLEYGYYMDGKFSDGLAVVCKRDADGNVKYGYIDTTGAVVVPLEYDGAGIVYTSAKDGFEQTSRYRWVQKGASYGIFENPYYVAPEAPSDPEPGNSAGPGGETPAPGSSGSQDTQNPAGPGDTGNTNDNGGGFPVVPVAAAVVLAAATGAAVAVLVLKKKK